MRATRIAILTAGHLCHNPRVTKEASALARSGCDVEILGAWFEPELKARDQAMLQRMHFKFTPVIDLTSMRLSARALGLSLRVRSKSARALFRWTGLPSSFLLGLATDALRRTAQELDADLYIAHLEPSLPVALALLRSGRRVGVDMEDWYSEDLLPVARQRRPIAMLADLERQVLRDCAYATCPSHAMSEALTIDYECRPPTVVYNAFPWSGRASSDHLLVDRKDRQIPSIHWYSQTVGPGRGLEDLFSALPGLKFETEIHLRGRPVPGFEEWLASLVPVHFRHRVFIHALVPNEQLLSRIEEHDIGFAGEMKFCRSRDLTVTNKILEYLLAGLAVVASDTTGQREVAAQAPDAVFLYPSGDSSLLAGSLNVLLGSRQLLQSAKQAALRAAEERFCWERQERAFLEAVMRAVNAP